MAALRDRGDAAIKLFGRTIPLLDAAAEVVTKLGNDANSNDVMPCVSNKLLNVEATPFCSKNREQNDQAISKHGVEVRTGFKSEEIKTGSDGSGQDKVLKKPDIIVPCPRCNSMETKFCYFNNYNVSQPRHFCRNCQRYWTAGGNIRNVPVGSGRRRNKHASHFRHAMMSCDANIAAPGDVSNEIHHLALPLLPQVLPGPIKENKTVKEFGSQVPVCKPMSSIHNIEEQKDTYLVALASGDNSEEQSCPSPATVSGCSENQTPDSAVKKEPSNVLGYYNGITLPHPHGPALVFPWSPGWNSIAVMAAAQCSTEPIQGLENVKHGLPPWAPPLMMAAPGICTPVVPFPMMPPPLWSCIPGWPNGMWSSPCPGNNGPPNKITCSEDNSPTLGKHSRESDLQEENRENNVQVPKTLRIDDPSEATKSSVRDTLGIKPDEKGLFEPLQMKVLKNDKTPESPQALQANPAAFLRSQSFQERT
ncbi:hypothetical protein CFC21_035150 [Triticum aestivum]|uniref:Dof-type domain-containing protein n=3 Tax=Triticum TaxID=4564 RepID=A0A9R0RGY3_TRITD|nr:cyclic dof factor 3-like [Triticum aestivum]KAF7022366.1 hypothetical protein CFC21_035150 [Triticum aestivum]VAH60270.1 unnamed protein product [Triticum turgidum subsp. durum]